jgi:two-component system response regulator FixJ
MPAQSGIEVQERLHNLSPQTRVIFISGRNESATRALALEGGAFAFLSKPLDDQMFLATVRGALGE